MALVKPEEASSVALNTSKSRCYQDVGFSVIMMLQHKTSPLNIDIKNDASLSIPALHSALQRHP